MLSRQAQLRRYVVRPLLILIIVYVAARYHQHYKKNRPTDLPPPKVVKQYNLNINEESNFLPNPSYKILQHVIDSSSETFSSLYSHLDQQNDLKNYFKLVPRRDYYVALTNLENKLPYQEADIKILENEQKLLDQNETFAVCNAKRVLINEKYDIRLRVDLPDDHIARIRRIQKRWDAQFPSLIVQHYTSFHIILAYQYKDIADKEIFNQLAYALNEWQQYPFDIELDPIEICSFTDAITYHSVVADPLDNI